MGGELSQFQRAGIYTTCVQMSAVVDVPPHPQSGKVLKFQRTVRLYLAWDDGA